ncbi:hypothetical protein ABHN11_32075, partial [Brevibacillus centrosporus]|uniref:hypothetical protein n=1 Tax=Brevibacillus centrosporus TaxID=54910 RepID=UPI003D1B8167
NFEGLNRFKLWQTYGLNHKDNVYVLFVDNYLFNVTADKLFDFGNVFLSYILFERSEQLSQGVLCDNCFFDLQLKFPNVELQTALLFLQFSHFLWESRLGEALGHRLHDVCDSFDI